MSVSTHKRIGLLTDDLSHLHHKYGLNILHGKPPPSDFHFILAQFKNPLILVLVAAAVITFYLQEYTDTFVIALAVLLNTILGFIQERGAFKSLEALKSILTPKAWVIRDGNKQEVDARTIVPGDIVWLYEGDKVPADGIVLESSSLMINEAILTGESAPVVKIRTENEALQQMMLTILGTKSLGSEASTGSEIRSTRENGVRSQNQIFMGSVVASGSGQILVTRTGMQTEMGKIARDMQEHRRTATPLEKRLKQMALWLTGGVILMAFGVFTYGWSIGYAVGEMFTIAVALAVAAIPEGLVVALTAILAIGMQRILRRKAVVRSLVAAETLGSVTCVCVDKTGTLTEGKLQVVNVNRIDKKMFYYAAILANDMRDANELARWEWAKQESKRYPNWPTPHALLEQVKRDESIPFSVERRFLANRFGNRVYLSGAPEELLKLSLLTNTKRDELEVLIQSWSELGLRMVGLCYYEDRSEAKVKQWFNILKRQKMNAPAWHWLGVVGFEDPVRTSVKTTLQKAHRAGVSVKVITGDYRGTAQAVMKQLGIEVDETQILEGFELEKLTELQLSEQVKKVILFARTRPSQKLRIVEALKRNGEVIGMMGDGVNDAPALAAADIGMVVGDATEVAREAADMVLLDSNFRTIVAAIEEGRAIFENLRKTILYLLSGTFSEVIVVLGSLLLGMPPALAATQILWINMVSDGIPNLALTIDPKARGLLKRKPISPGASLINRPMRILIVLISVVTGLHALAVFWWYFQQEGLEVARTMVFVVISLGSLSYVFSCRVLMESVFSQPVWKNKWLLIAVAISTVLTVAPVYSQPLQRILHVVPLRLGHWLVASGICMIIVSWVEMAKWWYHQQHLKRSIQ